MNDILIVFLSLSLSGSILALILMALRPVVKNKLSQTWQYYIWLLVILRFLLPFTTQFSIVGEAVRQIHSISDSPTMVAIDPRYSVNDEYATSDTPNALNIPATSQVSQFAENEAPTFNDSVTLPIYWRDILNNIWVLWLVVGLALFVQKVTSYRSFLRYVKGGTEVITDTHIWDIYKAELAMANVKRPLPLYANDRVISPMLIGIFRPTIIIPNMEVSNDELHHIFRHELTHYNRLDFLYKWVVQITICLHWFNPLIYITGKQINKSCELSCDESIIKRLDEDGRIIYGDALMASLRAQGNYNTLVISITLSENANLVKERLDTIMSYKKKSGLITSATVLLTIMLIFGFTFTGAYAAAGSDINTQNNMLSNSANDVNGASNVADNYKQIVKTLDGTNVQNININVAFCTLHFEKSSGNTFEAVFTYPETALFNYDQYFSLQMNKDDSNSVNISTDYSGHDLINDVESVDEKYLMSVLLTIKIPQKLYDTVRLNLSAISDQTVYFDLDASVLEIISNSADISFKTDRTFDKFIIEHYVGDFDLQLKQLSKNMRFEIAISDFTLSLPSDTQNISLTVDNKDNAACELPTAWKQSVSGDRIVYTSGNNQHVINVSNGKHAMFRVSIGDMTTQYSDTQLFFSENTLTTAGIKDSNEEKSQVYSNINATQYSKIKHPEAINGANYFSWGRIDVVDNNGYAYQAIVFICNGSAGYVNPFIQALEQLHLAYPNSQNQINGFMDLIRDNRQRNYGDNDFSAIEKVTITKANGVQYEAYVVAICGSDNFMKSYHTFYEKVVDAYHND